MKESRTTNPIKTAVNALTLTAKKGEIYGLLGPNGAGKNDYAALLFPRSSKADKRARFM